MIREFQEAMKLALEALLRSCGIEPPRLDDVLEVLLAAVKPPQMPLRLTVSFLVSATDIGGVTTTLDSRSTALFS